MRKTIFRTELNALLGSLLLAASAAAHAYGPSGTYGYGTYPRANAPAGYGYGHPGYQANSDASAKESAEETAHVDTSRVAISSMRFQPATLTIERGEAVTWTQQDTAPHVVRISSGELGSFGSGTLQRGQSYTTTLDRPGTYEYFCALHPNMRGMIVVR